MAKYSFKRPRDSPHTRVSALACSDHVMTLWTDNFSVFYGFLKTTAFHTIQHIVSHHKLYMKIIQKTPHYFKKIAPPLQHLTSHTIANFVINKAKLSTHGSQMSVVKKGTARLLCGNLDISLCVFYSINKKSKNQRGGLQETTIMTLIWTRMLFINYLEF